MLIVSRKDAERILIRPGDGVDPDTTLAELFHDGPIAITVFSQGAVKMGVHTPRLLAIRRKGAAP